MASSLQLHREPKWADAPKIVLTQNPERKSAELFTVTDPSSGFSVSITDFGATVVRVRVPDRDGKVDDVNVGENSPEEILEHGRYYGAPVGRVANRIAKGKFSLDGAEYTLPINNGPNALHGGLQAFDKRWWNCTRFEQVTVGSQSPVVLEFELHSPDGEEGYPGTLAITLRYYISSMELSWEFFVKLTDNKKTLLNATNHAYWNLSGVASGVIDEMQIRINATKFMPVDSDCLVTGEVLETSASGFGDVRSSSKSFGELFKSFGDVDNSFLIEGQDASNIVTTSEPVSKLTSGLDGLALAAELYSPATGRFMTVHTNQAVIQVYSGNFMKGLRAFGRNCEKHEAVCLETQMPPNAIHIERFKNSIVLNPGQTYYHRTVHQFSIRK